MFEGFDLAGVRRITVKSYTLGGPFGRSEVVACTLEIERDEGVEERSWPFDEPYALATLLGLVEAINRAINRRRGA